MCEGAPWRKKAGGRGGRRRRGVGDGGRADASASEGRMAKAPRKRIVRGVRVRPAVIRLSENAEVKWPGLDRREAPAIGESGCNQRDSAPMSNPALNHPLVGIIMGSKSEWETMRPADETLIQFGVATECRIVQDHARPNGKPGSGTAAQARGEEGVAQSGCGNEAGRATWGGAGIGEWAAVMTLHFRQTDRGVVLDAFSDCDENGVIGPELERHAVLFEQGLTRAWAEPCPQAP